VIRGQGLVKQADHSPAIKRLFQKCECTGGVRTLSGALLGKRGNENDRQVPSLGDEMALKVQPIHTRHLHIGDQTRGIVGSRRAQEILGGFEPTRDEPEGPHKTFHSDTDRCVVIDDRNNRNFGHAEYPHLYQPKPGCREPRSEYTYTGLRSR
jgi:hypothetical protein